jgi:hydroxymethylbilane synthase
VSLPAIGQGAIGIECRQQDPAINELISALDDKATHICVAAERAMNSRLQGGCQVPIAGYALLSEDELWLRGLVGEPDGSQVLFSEIRGAPQQAADLGTALADDLLAQGADRILADLYAQD